MSMLHEEERVAKVYCRAFLTQGYSKPMALWLYLVHCTQHMIGWDSVAQPSSGVWITLPRVLRWDIPCHVLSVKQLLSWG